MFKIFFFFMKSLCLMNNYTPFPNPYLGTLVLSQYLLFVICRCLFRTCVSPGRFRSHVQTRDGVEFKHWKPFSQVTTRFVSRLKTFRLCIINTDRKGGRKITLSVFTLSLIYWFPESKLRGTSTQRRKTEDLSDRSESPVSVVGEVTGR